MPSPLTEVILDRIRTRGPMTVAEYMGLALYHPAHGYYTSAPRRSGGSGDFFTSVDLGGLFGELLFVQLAEMAEVVLRGDGAALAANAGRPSFDLVEAAAGNGRLSRDILDAAARIDPLFLESVQLYLVEASAAARDQQREVLGTHVGRLRGSGPGLPAAVHGVVLANELLDALPPHLVVVRRGSLREVFVGAEGGRLCSVEGPPSTPRLAQYLDDVGARLEEGWFAEINLAAYDWVVEAADRLARGFLLLIDYGHPASQLYSATHAQGTLTSFRAHASESREAGPGWLRDPGLRDLTSHVDLTGVRRAAEGAGLKTLGMLDQGYFLMSLGLEERLSGDSGQAEQKLGPTPAALRRRLALKTLLLPGGLGSTHKVMIFGKGVGTPALRGTAFKRLT